MTALNLRVAVIGAGPAGLYSVGHLLEQYDHHIEIDVIDRLPTPHGLVRAGVAPDHPEKKLVIDNMFDIYLNHPKVRFFGNLEAGLDISHEELTQWYDAVIYSVGASSDARLGIPGEDLAGSWAAREFVAWYNGHPDYSELTFDFSHKRAVVVGNGNVALDVARILTRSPEALSKTDIADYALDALRKSAIKEVVILGRRGHFQGAFNNPELEELADLDDVEIVIENQQLPQQHAPLLDELDWPSRRKVETLERLANNKVKGASKRIVLRFLSSPIELIGDGHVAQIKISHNRLIENADGEYSAAITDQQSILNTGLVFRSIGYRGEAMPSLPFDEHKGVIVNHQGRVVNHNKVVAGTYVAGWIKRGPRGVIGSNKKCACGTVRALIKDAENKKIPLSHLQRDEVKQILLSKKPDVISKNAWQRIDRLERAAGQQQARPRVKQTDWQQLLASSTNPS